MTPAEMAIRPRGPSRSARLLAMTSRAPALLGNRTFASEPPGRHEDRIVILAGVI